MSDTMKYCTAAFWAAASIAWASLMLHLIGGNSSKPLPAIVLLPYLLMPSFLILGLRDLSRSPRLLSLAVQISAVAYYLALAVFVFVLAAAPDLTTTLRGAASLSSYIILLSYVCLCAAFAFVVRPNRKSVLSFVLWFLISYFWFITFQSIGRRYQKIQV